MILIKGGIFTMGSSANEVGRDDNEGPQHQATLSSFYIGKYEVTQAEYQAVMGLNPHMRLLRYIYRRIHGISWCFKVVYYLIPWLYSS